MFLPANRDRNEKSSMNSTVHTRPDHAVVRQPTDIILREEQQQAIDQAIDHLPPDCRRVLLSRHRDGESFRSISRRLGMQEAEVRQVWAQAVEQLLNELEKDETFRGI